jgi:hypothetical protein
MRAHQQAAASTRPASIVLVSACSSNKGNGKADAPQRTAGILGHRGPLLRARCGGGLSRKIILLERLRTYEHILQEDDR